jgi:ribonuclease HI
MRESKFQIFIDGASRGNPGRAALGIRILSSLQNSRTLKEVFEKLPDTTNNQAEYLALIRAFIEARNLGGTHLEIFSDSELLVQQMNGIYRVRDENLKLLHRVANWLKEKFKNVSFKHISRGKNIRADFLANKALDESVV